MYYEFYDYDEEGFDNEPNTMRSIYGKVTLDDVALTFKNMFFVDDSDKEHIKVFLNEELLGEYRRV